MTLFDHIKIKRRYSRSVNLERDLEVADSVNGYIVTPKANELAHRFFEALTEANSVRAWTLTGVYGTGKSAFAHFLTALCSAKDEKIRANALHILKETDSSIIKTIKTLSERGLVKAVATSQREPIAHTVIRALKNGSDGYWNGAKGKKPAVLADIEDAVHGIAKGKEIDNKLVLSLIQSLAHASRSGLLIIIDELGKNLEYAAQNQTMGDLYLLQQIAELPTGINNPHVFFIGLLHQAFYEYSHGLASASRSEWAKIQGRFEDIPFSESPDRLLHLIKNAIEYKDEAKLKSKNRKWSIAWEASLQNQPIISKRGLKDISSVYPFHPIAAVALPILCNKYSQNDRTLFTFLASDEPHAFKAFLKRHDFPSDKVATLKIDQLYDYFVESAGIALSSRPQYQRWIEIQSRISEARDFDLDAIKVLKTIGVLNLISNTGTLKASREIVSLCLIDIPDEKNSVHWDKIIDSLIQKGFVIWRKQYDELRIWEGSDFDIEQALTDQAQIQRRSLSELLNGFYPFKPLILRRHSYESGTIRYFERIYCDTLPEKIACAQSDSDGIVCHVMADLPRNATIQAYTTDRRPIVIIMGRNIESLRATCIEYVGLKTISETSKELQSDGVARREVKSRIIVAGRHLEDAITHSFKLGDVKCWIAGAKEHVKSEKDFNMRLSTLCDKTYHKGPHLWNELINRRELTSQGVKARRELIDALINKFDQERLGIVGHGPEYSMYESLIKGSGIHRFSDEKWHIDEPNKHTGIYKVWKAIEKFCLSSNSAPRPVSELYNIIEKPPYGAKKGAIPVLFVTVLLYHNEYVSLYYDGTYVPIFSADQFDLLVKRPDLFAVKYFEISGLKAQIFKELEEIVTASVPNKKNIRNATVLSIVNPLIRFVRSLPQYTQRTQNLSSEAKAVRSALLEAKDPDDLLFKALPQACGFSFINLNTSGSSTHIKVFRKKLVQALQEIQTAYDQVLQQCKSLVGQAFSVQFETKELRNYLKAIGSRINARTQVVEVNLKRFIKAMIADEQDDKAWLEAILMVIADKPVASWSDNDVLAFEIKLGDSVRRFKNIESIIDLKNDDNEGFEARKITVTYPTGRELNEVIWLDQKEKEEVNRIADKIVDSNLANNSEKLNKAILTSIIERLFEVQKEDKAKGQEEKKKYGR